MKLEDLHSFHYAFNIDDLKFKVVNMDDDNIWVAVMDAGGMQIGEFVIDYEDDTIELDDSDSHPGTLERLRKSGNSDAVMRNVKKMVNSL